MKKRVVVFMMILFCMVQTLTAFAGSVPEDLLYSDKAQVFFAEVLAYYPDKEKPDIEVSPVETIKGEVKNGTKQIYNAPMPVGGFAPKSGAVYLFAYYDEHNPLYIFETSGEEPANLRLKNIEGIEMWERLQTYLNDGSYEKAEAERQGKDNVSETFPGEIPKTKRMLWMFLAGAAAVLVLELSRRLIKKREKRD